MQQSFYLQVISAKCEDWPKALIVNIMAWRPKKKRNKDTLFAAIPNVWEKSGLTFLQKPYPTGDGCNYPRLPEKQNIQTWELSEAWAARFRNQTDEVKEPQRYGLLE